MGSINFITKRSDHDPYVYTSQKIVVSDKIEPLNQYLKRVKITGFDTEFNRGRLFKSNMLLASIGEAGNIWVVDMTCMLKEFQQVFNDNSGHIRMVGHNLQAEKTICAWHGLNFNLMWDTMLAEQRLVLGSGLSVSLAKTYERRLKVFMPEDKDIRLEFLDMNLTSKFMPKHITYSGHDSDRIVEIANIQRDMLIERGQFEFVKNVECELVSILTEMKLEGVRVNEEGWKNIVLKKQKQKLEVENIMDQEVSRLTNTRYKVRRRGEYISLDLFGDHKEKENENKKKLNYASPVQVLNLIRKLNEPLPQLVQKGKTSNSTKEEALQQYIIERPFTPIRFLLENLVEYRGFQKFVTSYGKKFLREEIRKKGGKKELGFKLDSTGNVHTNYKQCFTDTGRLSSGSKDEGLFNSQNIVTEKEVRECFTLTQEEIDNDIWITTCDWSQAELLIMAALADDQHLYELGADKIIDGVKVEGDLHSVLATKCWRAVYNYRKSNGRDMTIQDTKGKKYQLMDGFIVDKKNNKQIRTDFKRMGFGVVYGMRSNKGSQTLNIPKDEATIVIDVIAKEIPKTMQMVSNAAMCAFADGYVVFNKKTNNRRFFPEVVNILRQYPDKSREERYQIVKETLDFRVASDIEGEARNTRIQGTQADMLKEAMVLINQHIKNNNIWAKFIFTVHDELVIKHKGKEFGAEICRIMKETANSYLALYSDNIRMNAEYQTLRTWTK